jgi:hypothetical protein
LKILELINSKNKWNPILAEFFTDSTLTENQKVKDGKKKAE